MQSNDTTPVVIYGPAGCGKTRYAQALARHYRKPIIMDDVSKHDKGAFGLNALYLTNEDLSDSDIPHAIPFHVAARAAGIKVPDKDKNDNQPRYCKDCKHCSGDLKWGPKCSAKESEYVDLVQGPLLRSCEKMRRTDQFCGSSGRFYVVKESISFSSRTSMLFSSLNKRHSATLSKK
ncbi:hypothetical protein [Oxalobacter formigenes]|uniref:hypothetical protein n=1 Tax=Oxalobacter formigenes TaxID=847 RepID=UPI000A29F386|nr:hypothetical protein [Oxalobacter formigenes]ARQ46105.1 hypothetical protein BRW83_1362 [Oxalobacter formigenes]MCZ4062683.1 hypothetical protein [Oxalobacter formigenes]QDX33159.1 hypothetical protein FPZ51_05975 [Oxalobacter formigenes]